MGRGCDVVKALDGLTNGEVAALLNAIGRKVVGRVWLRGALWRCSGGETWL